MKKVKVIVGKFIRYCSGVQHQAWYESNVGVIRKPIQGDSEKSKLYSDKIRVRRYTSFTSWWQRLVLFIKKLIRIKS